MKRVFINGRFLCRPMTGVDRFAAEVIKAIDALVEEGHPAARECDWQLLAPREPATRLALRHISLRVLPCFSDQLWEQVLLPLFTAGSMLVNLCNAAPMFKRKQLVVVHDAASVRVPESYSLPFRTWYRLMIPAVLRFSQHVGTVSHFSRRELLDVYGIRRAISVYPEGAEHLLHVQADPTVLDSHDLRRRPYVLAVGSMAPHKNFQVLADALRLLNKPPLEVVIAGGADPRVFSTGQRELPGWVKHVGYVSDGQLKSLYEQAACFVFPSRYEGYGLPPTEAMALGCPVLCARSASLPEVCGDAARYFDATSTEQLAAELLAICGNTEIAARLRERGFENVKHRTWRSAALALLDDLSPDLHAKR